MKLLCLADPGRQSVTRPLDRPLVSGFVNESNLIKNNKGPCGVVHVFVNLSGEIV